jgi:DNA primase
MSDRTQIEEIKSKLDIVSVVSQYVPTLKRSGRNHFGLCPFHKEKTPSFSVNSELGLFKCFGCQEAGDVIKFIEKIEGLDFPKALEEAAKRAGVVLKKTSSPRDIEAEKQKKDLLSANSLACEFYNYLLLKHPSGEICREYAQKRKLPKDILEKFKIGYAPAGYENLKNFLIKKGFNQNDLVNWGLLVNKNGKIYDKFRKRFMFPIISHQGDIIGFSGRLIDPEDKGPKYLNSPETPVYKKSNTLFGLYQSKEAIRKEGFAVLVEGNVDILSSHKAGIKNIVAPLGTALTSEQVSLLKRYCDTVYFALDTDDAGQKALIKDLGMVDFAGMNSSILDIGQYNDVDALITNGGNWEETVKNPKDVVIYFIETLQKKYDLTKPLEKNKFIKQILEIITRINNPVLINDYLNKMVGIVRIDLAVLASELKKIKEILKTNNIDTLPETTVLNIGSNAVLENENMRTKYFLGLLMNRGIYKNVKLEDRFEEIEELIFV